MGALTSDELDVALDARAEIVAWREAFVAGDPAPRRRVHVKLDTGMGRLGTRDAAEATRVADAVAAAPAPRARRRDDALRDGRRARRRLHAASSSRASSRGPRRCAPAIPASRCTRPTAPRRCATRRRTSTSCAPASRSTASTRSSATRPTHGLEPALELHSYVAEVKPIAPGESAGYGRRFVARAETTLATVPIGYGDGVRRALTEQRRRARRRPAAARCVGTVSMDNVTVELGAGRARRRARRRGGAHRRAGRRADPRRGVGRAAWARSTTRSRAGSSRRVPRAYHRDGVPEP